ISDNQGSTSFGDCIALALGGGINATGPTGGLGTLTVTSSTISGNSVQGSPPHGGGIYSNQRVTLTNVTISDNSSSSVGGGISLGVGGALTVTNSTISNNSAPTGGGIDDAGVAQIGDTILNAGVSGGTISNRGGTVISLGYNLASDDGGGV